MREQYMVGFFLSDEEKQKVKKVLNKTLGLSEKTLFRISTTTTIFVDLARRDDERPASKVAESMSKNLGRTASVVKIDVDDIIERSKEP